MNIWGVHFSMASIVITGILIIGCIVGWIGSNKYGTGKTDAEEISRKMEEEYKRKMQEEAEFSEAEDYMNSISYSDE